jgi:superfamily II DNA or RNA helicase
MPTREAENSPQDSKQGILQTVSAEFPSFLIVQTASALSGGMGQKQRKEAISKLHCEGPRLVLATGRYLGEGFDDDRLDTLLLAMPISWKGTLAQYAGRLNRIRPGKYELTIYDYADLDVPMLKRMFQRRVRGYNLLSYSISDEGDYLRSKRLHSMRRYSMAQSTELT